MSDYLTDTDIAREYLARGGYASADHLVAWMHRRNIGHRNAAKVALAVNELRQSEASQPAPTPSEAAWHNDQAEGIGDRRPELELAQHVAGLNMQAYAAERERLGTAKGTAAFLAGL